jgi:hypothetical protein
MHISLTFFLERARRNCKETELIFPVSEPRYKRRPPKYESKRYPIDHCILTHGTPWGSLIAATSITYELFESIFSTDWVALSATYWLQFQHACVVLPSKWMFTTHLKVQTLLGNWMNTWNNKPRLKIRFFELATTNVIYLGIILNSVWEEVSSDTYTVLEKWLFFKYILKHVSFREYQLFKFKIIPYYLLT